MLGAHADIGAAIGFSGDNSDLGYSRFAVSIEHFRTVANNSTVLLGGAWQEAGNILQRQQGNIEAVTGTDKAGRLIRGIDIQTTGHDFWLTGDDAHASAAHANQTGKNVRSKSGLIFQNLAVVRQ